MTTPKESGWRERFDQLLLAHIAIQSGWLAGVNTGNEFHEAGNRIKDLIAQVEATAIAAPPPNKHNFEFQEICEKLEPIYGKLVWTLPHQAGVTEHKIIKAHEIAVKRGKTIYPYLKGIIKRLP